MFDIEEQKQQTIRFTYPPGPATRALAEAFSLSSQNPIPARGWPATLEPLGKALTTQIRAESRRSTPAPGTYVLVGFSGGKDSTAAALKILNAGAHPILFYVKGINRSYPGEIDAAHNIADMLSVELIVQPVSVSGSSDYIENPIKNQLILAMMVDHGMRIGVKDFAQGNLLCDTVQEYDISCGYSDCYEMYDVLQPFFSSVLPGYRYHHLLEDDTDSLDTIVHNKRDTLPLIQSCMTPLRYREKLHNDNNRKYGVQLMTNRCGSCYKCAIEWLHLMLWGDETPNRAFAHHCIDMLVRGLARTFGRSVTREEAVSNYFNTSVANKIRRYM